MCGTKTLKTEEATGNTINNYLRHIHIHRYYHGMDSFVEEMEAYPDVNYRYLIMETDGAGGLEEIDFANTTTWPLQMHGR